MLFRHKIIKYLTFKILYVHLLIIKHKGGSQKIYEKCPKALQAKTGVNRQILMSRSVLSMGTKLSDASVKDYRSQ